MDAAFHGAARKVEDISDLVVRQIFDVAKQQDLAMIFIELSQRRADEGFGFGAVHRRVGAGLGVGQLAFRRIIGLRTQRVVTPIPATGSVHAMVLAMVQRDLEHPGRQLALAPKPRKGAVQRDEHVLRCLFCALRVVQPAPTKRVHPVLIPTYNLVKRPMISVLKTVYQIRIRRTREPKVREGDSGEKGEDHRVGQSLRNFGV